MIGRAGAHLPAARLAYLLLLPSRPPYLLLFSPPPSPDPSKSTPTTHALCTQPPRYKKLHIVLTLSTLSCIAHLPADSCVAAPACPSLFLAARAPALRAFPPSHTLPCRSEPVFSTSPRLCGQLVWLCQTTGRYSTRPLLLPPTTQATEQEVSTARYGSYNPQAGQQAVPW